MTLIGHDHVLQRFSRTSVHAPLLFIGPTSVGKWTAAEQLRRDWQVSDSDVLRIRRLSGPIAREAVQFAYQAPVAGSGRLIIVRMHQSTQEHQNVLLKAVEEAPDTTRFILITSDDSALPTMASRCIHVLFNLLHPDDLQAILEDRGFKAAQARVWAERGEGQVKRALAHREVTDAKTLVSMVVRSFREKDPMLLSKVADGWTDAHTDLLVIWCNETVSRRWVIFTEEEALPKGVPMRMLVALRADVRPKLVVKSVLADLLRSMT